MSAMHCEHIHYTGMFYHPLLLQIPFSFLTNTAPIKYLMFYACPMKVIIDAACL